MWLFHPVGGLCMHTEPVLSGCEGQAQQLSRTLRGCLMATASFSFALPTEHTHPACVLKVCLQLTRYMPVWTNIQTLPKSCLKNRRIGLQCSQCANPVACCEFSVGVEERNKHKCLWLIQAGQDHTQEGCRQGKVKQTSEFVSPYLGPHCHVSSQSHRSKLQ